LKLAFLLCRGEGESTTEMDARSLLSRLILLLLSIGFFVFEKGFY